MTQDEHSSLYYVVEYGKPSDRVVFLFCPFGIPSWQLTLPGLPIWHLTRAGYQVIAYGYNIAIAKRTAQVTLQNIQAIMNDADGRIARLPAHIQVSCYGTSMGTILAMNFTARHSRVAKVVLNLCYADIVEHMQHLPRMLLLPKKRVAHYITDSGGLDRLHAAFDAYSPINLVRQLKGRAVLLQLARHDRVLQYRHTQNLPEALRKAGARVEYQETGWLGHYFSAFYNHLHARRYLEFLRK